MMGNHNLLRRTILHALPWYKKRSFNNRLPDLGHWHGPDLLPDKPIHVPLHDLWHKHHPDLLHDSFQTSNPRHQVTRSAASTRQDVAATSRQGGTPPDRRRAKTNMHHAIGTDMSVRANNWPHVQGSTCGLEPDPRKMTWKPLAQAGPRVATT